MAFVSEAERRPGISVVQSASGGIGPGEYHNEGYLHKRAMQTIYPKKAVPFNAVSKRGLSRGISGVRAGINSSPGKLLVFVNLNFVVVVGPGQYKMASDFDLNSYRKAMDDKGTYLTLDNGHLNQKRQMYK